VIILILKCIGKSFHSPQIQLSGGKFTLSGRRSL
jgi:hypothetical protein